MSMSPVVYVTTKVVIPGMKGFQFRRSIPLLLLGYFFFSKSLLQFRHFSLVSLPMLPYIVQFHQSLSNFSATTG